jgi:Ni,Fe-hydrogenase I small subunit
MPHLQPGASIQSLTAAIHSCTFCLIPLILQAAYVSAGQAGAEIVVNGAESNPAVLALGVAATLGAISLAGDMATKALEDLDVDLSAE